jgi:hypothetical protein
MGEMDEMRRANQKSIGEANSNKTVSGGAANKQQSLAEKAKAKSDQETKRADAMAKWRKGQGRK